MASLRVSATSRQQFEAAAGPHGAQFVGDASELTDKILAHYEIFGFDRFVIQMAIGVMEHAKLLKAIEILGTRVAPEVKKAVGERRTAAA
jgi:alkanesulfonate monooxygenase SsuD/methylene tetrahydromethanopterin reductase-like flavin-dependent oxidoreductase (luciferase family)